MVGGQPPRGGKVSGIRLYREESLTSKGALEMSHSRGEQRSLPRRQRRVERWERSRKQMVAWKPTQGQVMASGQCCREEKTGRGQHTPLGPRHRSDHDQTAARELDSMPACSSPWSPYISQPGLQSTSKLRVRLGLALGS